MDEQEHKDFLQWEYTAAGRSVSVWAAAAYPLLRSADLLWARAVASAQLWNEAFTRDERGLPVATGPQLAGDEIDIFGDRDVDRAAVLLLGFAIENLAKSVLVARNPGLVTDEAEYRGPASHNIGSLVQQCGIAVTPTQQASLNALADYETWLGRYPVPKHREVTQSVLGAWIWHRVKARQDIWTECRPLADHLARLRDTLPDGGVSAS